MDDSLEMSGLCLLSLDGGGVRGLSSLHILKRLMDELNYGRKTAGLDAAKPCDVFDMIAGTSTGGLIAIMLGRLEMDVDECIEAYNELSEKIFSRPKRRFALSTSAKIVARFDSAKLEEAIVKIIVSRGLPPDTLFDDGKTRRCRTFVCAASKDLNIRPEKLRSYSSRGRASLRCTICQAALATSAAPGFFDPVEIGGRHFVDGALGANNPVEQVEEEARDVWCHERGDLASLVKCFVSVGTGKRAVSGISSRIDQFIVSTLKTIATDTERSEISFLSRWRGHYEDGRVFRFNVEHGLQAVVLSEYAKKDQIETATAQYMDQQAQSSSLRRCVQNLQAKQNKAQDGIAHFLETETCLAVLPDREFSSSPRPSSSTGVPQHWLPFPKNVDFVGRGAVLQSLMKMLFDGGDEGFRRVALYGLGGVGKTEMAISLAHRVKDIMPGWSVFWLRAASMASFDKSCSNIARALGLRFAHSKTAKELVRDHLSREMSGPWLIILDNADDEGVVTSQTGVTSFLPRHDRGRILVTSRSKKIATQLCRQRALHLEKMNEEESMELLDGLLGADCVRSQEEMAELLNILTYLPLVIIQAAAYMNEQSVSVKKYLELLQHADCDIFQLFEAELDNEGQQPGTSRAVANTWVVSFEQIRKHSTAVSLLNFLSFIEYKDIPDSILPRVGSETDQTRAIGILCGYSFISKREDEATGETMYDMHRLVQLAVRLWQSKQDDNSKQRKNMLSHLVKIFFSAKWEERETWRKRLPHVLSALHGQEPRLWGQAEWHLGYWVGECLILEGQYRESVQLLEQVVAVQQQTAASDDPVLFDTRLFLARAYSYARQGDEADKIIEGMAKTYRLPPCEDDPDRITWEHHLALFYMRHDQTSKAIQLLTRHLEIEGRTLAETNQNRLATQGALGDAWLREGQSDKAIELLEGVCRVWEQSVEVDHPLRCSAESVLAVAYRSKGQYKKAAELFEVGMTMRCQAGLGESHPDMVASQLALAEIHTFNGDTKESLRLLKRMEDVVNASFGETEFPRLNWFLAYARACVADGQSREAVKLLLHVREIASRKHSAEHPFSLYCENQLAWALLANKEVSAAVEIYENIASIRRRTLNPDDYSRLISELNLAGAYASYGRVSEAIDLFEDTRQKMRNVVPGNHPQIYSIALYLATGMKAAGDIDKCILFLQSVLQHENTSLVEDTPRRLAVQNRLGVALRSAGRVGEAIEMFEHVARVRGRDLAEEHPDRLATQHELAITYRDVGLMDKAAEILEKVVEVEDRTLEEGDPARDVSRDALDETRRLMASGSRSTLALKAAGKGHVEVLQRLVEAGVSISAPDDSDCTPIEKAAYHGHAHVVKFLLAHGVGTAAENPDGWTPIMHAAEKGHVAVVEMLLESGANHSEALEDGHTPLSLAAYYGHVDVVRLLLKHGADRTARDKRNRFPIEQAAYRGHAEVVEAFLEQEPNIACTTPNGCMPLLYAAGGGHAGVARLLLTREADVDAFSEVGWTPLMAAAYSGHVEVVTLLLEHGADVTAQGDDGMTAFLLAVERRHAEVAKLLLQRDATQAGHSNRLSCSSLIYASRSGNLELTRLLLANEHAELATADWLGSTALAIVVRNGHSPVVEFLLASATSLSTERAMAGDTGTLLPAEESSEAVDADSYATSDGEAEWCDACHQILPSHFDFLCKTCFGDIFGICADCVEKGVKCPQCHGLTVDTGMGSHVVLPAEYGLLGRDHLGRTFMLCPEDVGLGLDSPCRHFWQLVVDVDNLPTNWPGMAKRCLRSWAAGLQTKLSGH